MKTPQIISLIVTMITSTPVLAESKTLYSLSLKDIETEESVHSELSEEDLEILQEGPISEGRRVSGGLLGTLVGMGTGHMVTGKWDETGWIFTFGEPLAYGLMIYGMVGALSGFSESSSSRDHGMDRGTAQTLITVGALSFVGLRIFEIYDVWARPAKHNDRYEELKSQASPQVSFGIAPTTDGVSGAMTLRF